MEIEKNLLYEMDITGITNEGNGVGRLDGYAVFVPGTAEGDRCLVRLVKCQKSYGYGRVEQLLLPSPDRIPEDCAVAGPCGGCSFRHISYDAELRCKQEFVQDAFRRLGGIDAPVRAIIGSPRIEGYRNKAQYPVAPDGKGGIVSGFFARRSHRIIPITDCALQSPVFGEILREIMDWLTKNSIPAYNPEVGAGLVRHIYLRTSEATGEIMVCLVVTKAHPERYKAMCERLVTRFPDIRSIVLNVNPENTNVILGERCVTLWGQDSITDLLGGVRVRISPLSFYQVNHAQAESLYRTALEMAQLSPEDTLLDLYCGAGTIGLAAAGRIKSLIGVEIVPEAIHDANENARRNGIGNARFLCADAGAAATQLAREGIQPDVVVVDPPRKGLDAAVMEAICSMGPRRVVMVSCNPSTAARDTAWLRDHGYTPQEIVPVDMFPRTTHIEVVIQMTYCGDKKK